MKTVKKIAALAALVGCVLAGHEVAKAQADEPEMVEKVKITGVDGQVLGSYVASEVGSIDFVEEAADIIPEIDDSDILIQLSPDVSFHMIKVEGGVPYTLTGTLPFEGSAWSGDAATKQMETFWIGMTEVTQGEWKEVMGVTTLPTASNGSQTLVNDKAPIACVSWNAIAGSADGTYLKKLNARLAELKAANPALAQALGNREFRLPDEWEWSYAAAGGKDYAELNYYFAGTSGTTAADLETVAVNSVSPNKATSVATVGSKQPNNLGLVDMSGNVLEWCSGTGYPGHKNEVGFLGYNSKWDGSYRPYRGGHWNLDALVYFRVARFCNVSHWANSSYVATYSSQNIGFRLAL